MSSKPTVVPEYIDSLFVRVIRFHEEKRSGYPKDRAVPPKGAAGDTVYREWLQHALGYKSVDFFRKWLNGTSRPPSTERLNLYKAFGLDVNSGDEWVSYQIWALAAACGFPVNSSRYSPQLDDQNFKAFADYSGAYNEFMPLPRGTGQVETVVAGAAKPSGQFSDDHKQRIPAVAALFTDSVKFLRDEKCMQLVAGLSDELDLPSDLDALPARKLTQKEAKDLVLGVLNLQLQQPQAKAVLAVVNAVRRLAPIAAVETSRRAAVRKAASQVFALALMDWAVAQPAQRTAAIRGIARVVANSALEASLAFEALEGGNLQFERRPDGELWPRHYVADIDPGIFPGEQAAVQTAEVLACASGGLQGFYTRVQAARQASDGLQPPRDHSHKSIGERLESVLNLEQSYGRHWRLFIDGNAASLAERLAIAEEMHRQSRMQVVVGHATPCEEPAGGLLNRAGDLEQYVNDFVQRLVIVCGDEKSIAEQIEQPKGPQ
jgi:hypothetical protein